MLSYSNRISLKFLLNDNSNLTEKCLDYLLLIYPCNVGNKVWKQGWV